MAAGTSCINTPCINKLVLMAVGTIAVTEWGNVNKVTHLSKTHLNLLEMCEISFVDAAMSRA